MPTYSIARSSKIYPNWDFGFENQPSGNPDLGHFFTICFYFLNSMKVLDFYALKQRPRLVGIVKKPRGSTTGARKNGGKMTKILYFKFQQDLLRVG
jgi:hypothetical protein